MRTYQSSVNFAWNMLSMMPFQAYSDDLISSNISAKYAKDNMQQRVLNWTHKYGPICKQRLGNDWYVFLTDPIDIEKVFRNDRKYPFRGVLPLTKVYTKRTNTSPGLTGL